MSGLNPLFYSDHVRRLHSHKLPWWRHLLGPFCGLHFCLVVVHLYFDWNVLGPKYRFLRFLEILVVLFSISSRIIWQYLFRDPYQFLHFRRPSQGYRGAVYTVSAATTIPSFIFHFPIIYIDFKADRTINISYYLSILCLIVLLALCAYYLRMVHHFLLGDDVDEEYGPTAPLLEGIDPTVLEPYHDDPPLASVNEPSSTVSGRLASAYALQQAISPLLARAHTQEYDEQGLRVTTTPPVTEPVSTVSDAASPTDTAPSTSSTNQPGATLICPTIAKFDYMPENRFGPHSWPSYHFAIAILVLFSTLVLVLVWNLIYEDKHSRLSFSPKAKCGLRVPLGGYILALYAATYRSNLRKSTFTRSYISLPVHWTRMKSWMKKPVFMNSETGTSTAIDPRRRKLEVVAEQKKAGTSSAEYMNAYNADRQPCVGYWGHLGRTWNTEFRTTPTARHVVILGFATFQFFKGGICISNYPHGEGMHLPGNTLEDMLRFSRIMQLKICLLLAGLPFGVFVFPFVAAGALSILILFGGFVLENLPEEEKERLRLAREQARQAREEAQAT